MGCFHVCDRESDDEDSGLLLLMCQSGEIPKKDKFMYPFAFRSASLFKRRQRSLGGNRGEKSEKVTQVAQRVESGVQRCATCGRRSTTSPMTPFTGDGGDGCRGTLKSSDGKGMVSDWQKRLRSR